MNVKQKKNATKTKRAIQTEDAPMFNVLVIGDEEYNREHVVLSIQDIVPDTDNTRVRQNYSTSRAGSVAGNRQQVSIERLETRSHGGHRQY